MSRLVHGVLHAWLVTGALVGGLHLAHAGLDATLGLQFLRMLALPLELVWSSLTLALWIGTVLSPRVPLRVLLPGWLVAVWFALGALPVSLFVWDRMSLFQGVVQLGTIGVCVLMARSLGGPGPVLAIETLEQRPAFRWTRTSGMVLGHLTLLPLGLVTYLGTNLAFALNWFTGGFLVMGPAGISAVHRVYTLEDDTAHLIGMVHIGDEHAYRQLFETIPGGEQTLVLAEGVGDKQGLLVSPANAYAGTASRVGLSVQKPIEEITSLRVQNADLDVSSFDPQTIELLGIVLRLYGGQEALPVVLQDYSSFWSRHREDAEQVVHQLFEDIVHRRNRHLLDQIRLRRTEADHLVVPWGALHLKEISETLEHEGWTAGAERRILLVPFWN